MTTDDQGNEIGKLFVGGLHQTTKNENLKDYFSKFGEVQEASVMMDHKTGRSRGFGYVKFTDGDAVSKVMSINKHILDGKEIDPKPCNVNMKGKSRRSLKVFVGGIAPEHNEDTLREFFKQFGSITELTLMKDSSGHRHRGFAFVGFDDENVVKQLIADHYLTIGNKQVEIKPMEQQVGRNNNMDMTMALNMPGNKRGLNVGSMQSQWPQWPSAANAAAPWPTAGNPAAGSWGAMGPSMWDQAAAAAQMWTAHSQQQQQQQHPAAAGHPHRGPHAGGSGPPGTGIDNVMAAWDQMWSTAANAANSGAGPGQGAPPPHHPPPHHQHIHHGGWPAASAATMAAAATVNGQWAPTPEQHHQQQQQHHPGQAHQQWGAAMTANDWRAPPHHLTNGMPGGTAGVAAPQHQPSYSFKRC